MKFKMYLAAAFAMALLSCKNDGKSEEGEKATEKTAASEKTTASGNNGGVEAGDNVPEGSALLRLNYPKGFKQRLTYEMTTKAQGMDMDMTMTMDMKVVSVKPGGNPVFGFDAEISSMKMKTDAMGESVNYDSSKSVAKMTEEEKIMHGQIKQTLHQPISMSLDSKGNMVGKMKFKNVYSTNDPFDMSSYQVAYPEKPVKVGDSWTNEIDNKQYGGKVKSTYTVKRITPTEVELGLKAVIPPMKGLDKSTTFTGSYVLDRETGMVLRGDMAGKMAAINAEMKMSFTGKKI